MDNVSFYYTFFLQNGMNLNSFYRYEQILESLDQIGGIYYNREIANQLFERIEKNDGQITISDFVTVLMEAELVLNDKIQKVANLIDEYNIQKNNFTNNLNNTKREENYNPLGINIDNNLNIIIKELIGLNSGQDNFFVTINVGLNKIQTNKQKNMNGVINFNQNFNIKIENGTENIHFKLFQIQGQRNILIGESSIELNEISDQLAHDFPLEFTNNAIDTIKIRMNLFLQWTHSKVQYYQGLIERLNEEIIALEQDKNDYYQDLELLLKPFKIINTSGRNNQQTTYRNLNKNNDSNFGENLFLAPNKANNFKPEKELKESAFSEHAQDLPIRESKQEFLLTSAFTLTLFYIIFSILAGYMRANFIDIIISSGFFCLYVLNVFEKWFMKFLVSFTFFSLLIDLPWLIIYTNNWWDSTRYIEDSSQEQDILRLSVVMSYFILSIKAVLIFLFWKIGNQVEKLNKNFNFSFLEKKAFAPTVKS